MGSFRAINEKVDRYLQDANHSQMVQFLSVALQSTKDDHAAHADLVREIDACIQHLEFVKSRVRSLSHRIQWHQDEENRLLNKDENAPDAPLHARMVSCYWVLRSIYAAAIPSGDEASGAFYHLWGGAIDGDRFLARVDSETV